MGYEEDLSADNVSALGDTKHLRAHDRIEPVVKDILAGQVPQPPYVASSLAVPVERVRTLGMSDAAAAAAAAALVEENDLGGTIEFDAGRDYDLAGWHIEPAWAEDRWIVLDGQHSARLHWTQDRGTPTPRARALATGGTLGPGNYSYRLGLVTLAGEVMAGRRAQWQVYAGTTGSVVLTWDLPVFCRGSAVVGVKIYGRTRGAELLMATLGLVSTWTDTGAVTPAGALPAGAGLMSYAIDPTGPGCPVILKHLTAIGPVTSFVKGQAPSHMGLINLKSRGFIDGVATRGWTTAANFPGDHAHARRLKASGGYYGVSCFDAVTGHDNVLEECQLDGNMKAPIGIDTGSFLGGVLRGGHLGVSPFGGVFIEAGAKVKPPEHPNAGEATPSISKLLIDSTSAEAGAAGYLWDDNYNAIVAGVTLRDNGNWSLNSANAEAGQAPVVALFRASQILNWRIESQAGLGLSDPPVPPVWFDAGYLSDVTWAHCNIPLSLIGQVANYDVSYDTIAMRIQHSHFVGTLYRPIAALALGQLVELNASGDATPHVAGPIEGVALHAVNAYNSTTQRRGVVVATEGERIPLLTTVGAVVAAGDVLVANPADPSRVIKTTAAGQAIIGRAAAAASGGTVLAYLRMRGIT